MKKISWLVSLLFCLNANAGLIEIQAEDLVGLNDDLNVTLVGREFQSINSLSFLFQFDTDLLDFDSSSVLFSGGIPLATELATGVNFGFIFFAPVTDFTLTFNLSSIGLGSSVLSLENTLAGFQDLASGQVISESVQSVDKRVSIPEPNSLGVVILAGIILLFLRRRI